MRSAAAVSGCREKAAPWILAATILGSSMAFIDSTVVNVALPAIQANFRATVVEVQWVVESYGLFLAALILVGGSLGDMFGRRKVFLFGTAIFTLASLACGFSLSIRELILARSIQGLGAALLVPGSLAIISASFDEKRRGQAIGTWSGFTAITTAIGPVVGGWLVEHASWRWAFFLNLPLALAVIFIALWRIPESQGTLRGHIDWTGATFATLGLGGLVTGFIESVKLGWKHPLVFGSLIVGVASLLIFLAAEARRTSPMVPLGMFASRDFSGGNLFTLLLYAAIGIFFFLFPLNLIQVQGYSATAAGAAVLPFVVFMFVLSRWSGGLIARYGARRPLMIGPLAAALGFLLVSLPSVGGSYWKTFFPGVVVLGLGMAITVPPLTTVVMNSVGEDRVGSASGINNAVARVAGVLAIAVLGIVMVRAFEYRLKKELTPLSLPSEIAQQVEGQSVKLAGVPLPDNIDSHAAALLHEAINAGFTFGFRLVMVICAVLGIASAAVARKMITE